MFGPTIFTSVMFETASETVLFCRDVLAAEGHHALAAQLDVCLPVNTPEVARPTREVLQDALKSTKGVAKEYVGIALDTVNRALQETHALQVIVVTRLAAVA